MWISTEVDRISSGGTLYHPMLHIPLEIEIRPISQREGNQGFTLIELKGHLSLPGEERIAEFSTQPICHQIHDRPFSFPHTLIIPLDPYRIKRMEDVRGGGDMGLTLHFIGMVWIEGDGINKVSGGPLFLNIPQSHWVRSVLSGWGWERTRLVEVHISEGDHKVIPKRVYELMEEAIVHFNSGNDKEVLASIYMAFEAFAKVHGYEKPDQNFFAKLLKNVEVEDEKKEKLKLLFGYFCKFLHLGRHEPDKPLIRIERKDSEFALNMAWLTLGYISKLLSSEGGGKDLL